MSRRMGLSGTERTTLRMIGRHAGLSSGELARLLHLNPSTLTGVLDRLVQRRLLTRHADARDRRRIVVALTAAGKRLDRLRADTIEARFERALAARSSDEMSSASSVLEALARELSRPARR